VPGTYVGFLRGVNVGGKNKLPMKDLAAMFVAAGCGEVQTFIQSGNVVFKARPALASKIPALIAGQIADRFGYRTPVVIRTVEEMSDVLVKNPFLGEGVNEDYLHLMFLADTPSARAVSALDPERSPGDKYIVRGRDIYFWLPNGAGNSKLTNAYFDSKLATVSTIRNWRTVNKLLEMMRG